MKGWRLARGLGGLTVRLGRAHHNPPCKHRLQVGWAPWLDSDKSSHASWTRGERHFLPVACDCQWACDCKFVVTGTAPRSRGCGAISPKRSARCDPLVEVHPSEAPHACQRTRSRAPRAAAARLQGTFQRQPTRLQTQGVKTRSRGDQKRVMPHSERPRLPWQSEGSQRRVSRWETAKPCAGRSRNNERGGKPQACDW